MFAGKLICAAAFATLASSAVVAQGFGGSFDAPSPGGQQQLPAPGGTGFGGGSFDDGTPSQPPTGGGGGGFGGSFDNGNAQPEQQTGNTQPEQQVVAPPGGDNFSGGSFDGGGGTITPNPDAQPPKIDPGPKQKPEVKPDHGIDPQILAFETRDFGIPPTNRLRSGQMHGPTPTSVPGAQVIGTASLFGALQSGQQVLLIDVLGGSYSLPRAVSEPGLAAHGNFGDRTQQQAAQWLQQLTRGNSQLPIVIFCSDPQCWLSYNASRRVVA